MSSPIRKAVLPVAGLGTRFLPPPRLSRRDDDGRGPSALQYVVDEARAAGIEHIVVRDRPRQGRHRGSLRRGLRTRGDAGGAREVRGTGGAEARSADRRLGELHPAAGAARLGHAVWCARDIVGDEPFAVLLPDMLMKHDVPCLKSMVDAFGRTGGNIVSLESCDPAMTNQYGIVSLGKTLDEDLFEVTGMVEKPKPADAPSNLFISGATSCSRRSSTCSRPRNAAPAEKSSSPTPCCASPRRPVLRRALPRHDLRQPAPKLGFLEANLAYALGRDDIHPDIRATS